MKGLYLSILTIILFASILSVVTAQQDLPYRSGTQIDLKEVCIFNGTLCSGTAVCNITVAYPNGSTLVNNVPMSNRSDRAYFNYTIVSSRTDNINGKYWKNVICTDQGVNAYSEETFIINPVGNIPTTSQGIIYFIATIITLVMFALLLWGAIAIPWQHPRGDDGTILKFNDLRFAKIFCGILAYTSLIALTFLGFNISWGYLEFNMAGRIMEAFYWILISLFWPAIVVSFVLIVMQIIYSRKLKELIDRGIRFNE